MRKTVLTFLVLMSAGMLYGTPADDSTVRTIRVKLQAAGGAQPVPGGTLMLRAVMGPLPPITLPVSLATPLSFRVPAHTMWETTLVMKGWWGAPTVVAVQESDVDVTVTLLPTGVVAGVLAAPDGEIASQSLSVLLDVPPGTAKLPGPSSIETPCSVAKNKTFSCEVPAGVLDLSWHLTGWTPVYRWGVKVTKGSRTELGRFALTKGSSVSGFVALSGGKLEGGKGKVALFINAPGASGTAFRLSRVVGESVVAANGFFQIVDVPPGRYVLQAAYPGFASTTVSPLQVYTKVEAKIKRLIELQPPITLNLSIDPPSDFALKDWHVVLRRASTINNIYDGPPVFDGPAPNGSLILRGQQGGRYNVTVSDSSDNSFKAEEFVTSGNADESRTIHIESVRVKGTLLLGDSPLAATISFGGKHGDRHVTLRSNADGEFRGTLPRAGYWVVLVEAGTISTELHTDVTHKEADEESQIDLRIPSNHVSGEVIDASGNPHQGAIIYLANGPSSLHVRSNDSGHFHFDGVPAGTITLSAEDESSAGIKSSDIYSTTIGEDASLDGITLKLNDGGSLHGRILGRDGPVVGAEVILRPGHGFEQAPSSSATTGSDGVFDANVAAGYDRAVIVVSAPGYALRVFDVAIDGHAVTLNLPQEGGDLIVTASKNVNGLYFFQDDRYLTLLDIVHWLRAHGEPLPSGGATLEVRNMAPGRYRVCTLKEGGASIADLTRCAEGFLAPYGQLRLALP